MKRTVLNSIALIFSFLFAHAVSFAQTTVTTGLTGGSNAAASGVIVFGVTNNNAFPIAITTFSIYHNNGTQNGKNYTVWYTSNPTQINVSNPSVTTANGWVQLGTGSNISTSSAVITPVLGNQYLAIPPSATYRIAITCNTGLIYFSNTGSNSYTAGNVLIQTGASTVSSGWAGTMPNATQNPRYFAGSITFIPAAPVNVAAAALLLSPPPAPTSGYCSYDSITVRAVLRNDGSVAQSNFPVYARYTGGITGAISNTYTGTLAAYATDTFVVGKINAPQGVYSIRAYTQLSGDTVQINDTTSAQSVTFRKPNIQPVVVSDTVCPGDTAKLLIVQTIPNTVYRWYSAQSGGTLLYSGTSRNIPNLTQDTVIWIASDSASCQSARVQLIGKVTAPPAPYLGADTAFCESIPLILDAGYPGATFKWNTGDSTQTIAVTNVSGQYWVKVTQYCTRADTIQVTIRPLPTVSGISYVRMGNTYKFYPSSYQNVESFLWLFGDGNSSTDTTPVHTYSYSINVPLTVQLIVTNTCAKDTANRTVPTGVKDLALEDRVKVYPNPAHQILHFETELANLNEVYVVNMMGSVVMKHAASGRKYSLDISSLPAGNYILKLRTDEGDVSRPVQIIR